MKGIGVWERGEGLCDMLREDLKQNGIGRPRLLRGRHPAELAGEELDLLVVSPRAVGWGGAMRVNCRLVLLPGDVARVSLKLGKTESGLKAARTLIDEYAEMG